MNINTVALTGNLTKDPELRSTAGGTSVCTLRVAVNDRQKDASGEWVDRPYYFNVTVWSGQAEACAKYLAKGRPVAVQGKLTWREYEDKEGKRRESIEINAFAVQFLNAKGDGDRPAATDVPVQDDYVPIGAGAAAGGDEPPF